MFANIFCFLWNVLCSRTFFVPFVPFFTHVSKPITPTTITTTTKLLLGPLSRARGQKLENIIQATRLSYSQQESFIYVGFKHLGKIFYRLEATQYFFTFPNYWEFLKIYISASKKFQSGKSQKNFLLMDKSRWKKKFLKQKQQLQNSFTFSKWGILCVNLLCRNTVITSFDISRFTTQLSAHSLDEILPFFTRNKSYIFKYRVFIKSFNRQGTYSLIMSEYM